METWVPTHIHTHPPKHTYVIRETLFKMITRKKIQMYIMYIKNIRIGPPTGINVSIFWEEKNRERERERENKHNAATYLKRERERERERDLFHIFLYLIC